MPTRWFRLTGAVLAVCMTLAGNTAQLQAQNVIPTAPPPAVAPPRSLDPLHPMQTFGPGQEPPHRRTLALAEARALTPAATGGPDEYGYTWDDSVAFNWIDASGGTNTGLQNNCGVAASVPLSFSIKYYENTYNTVYVDFNGYMTFDANNGCYWHGQPKSSDSPNNVLAPYWGHFASGTGEVRYLQGGTAPNRYVVVAWSGMADFHTTSTYTFETVLHENGDIVFQYLSMNYPAALECTAIGIEDSTGRDGLKYTACLAVPNNRAVRFYRPPALARVGLPRPYHGAFTQPGATSNFTIPVRNLGDLGTDTYDFLSDSVWPLTLYADDGVTPLVDNDGDTLPDTNAVTQGSTVTVVAKLQAPNNIGVGAALTALLTVRSSLPLTPSKVVTLQVAVPTAFVQGYRMDYAEAIGLDLIQPGGRMAKRSLSGANGFAPAVVETPTGNFVYAWNRLRCTDVSCNLGVMEIEYMLLNRYGETIRGVTKVVDHSQATVYTYDFQPTIAVAPDGRIGLLWLRDLFTNTAGQDRYNHNVYLAILDANGNVTSGPTNLTGITAWGTWDTIPSFYHPSIAATSDNHLALAWARADVVPGCTLGNCSVDDVYYAVYDTAGTRLLNNTRFTNDSTTGTQEAYYAPNSATLSGNRVLLTWGRSSDWGIYYAVLNSAGGVVKDKTVLSNYTAYYEEASDAVQLTDGKTLVAWSGFSATYHIRYAVLDSNYNLAAGPHTLNTPGGAPAGGNGVSVAADGAGRGVLTWQDGDWNARRNLYYALVNSAGTLLTAPLAFFHSETLLETSDTGYGNTSFSSFTASVDGALAVNGSTLPGQQGGVVNVGVRYANAGQFALPAAAFTMTLSNGLTYLSNSAGLSATVNGNQVRFALPALDAVGFQTVNVYVGVPATATVGALYPLNIDLAVPGDENLANNVFVGNVRVTRPIYLPSTTR